MSRRLAAQAAAVYLVLRAVTAVFLALAARHKIKPLLVSKLNTVAQIVFASVVLGSLGFNYELPTLTLILMGLVAVLTLLSVAAYVAEWVRHMNTTASGP